MPSANGRVEHQKLNQTAPYIGFFFTRYFIIFLLVRDLSFQKVLVWVLLGFFQIQKVLVFRYTVLVSFWEITRYK